MFQIRNGKYYFILIDFDMAVILKTGYREKDGSYVATSKCRTGTLPFMACSLLSNASLSDRANWTPVKHYLCHDLESLFWASLHCVLTLFLQDVSTKIRRVYVETVQSWEKGKLSAIAGRKKDLCVQPLDDSGIELPPPALILERWFLSWSEIFGNAFGLVNAHARAIKRTKLKGEDPPSFDAETLGGSFTRNVLKAQLTPAMPYHQDNADMELEDDSVLDEVDQALVSVAVDGPPPAKAKGRGRSKKLQAAMNVVSDIRSRLRPRKRAM